MTGLACEKEGEIKGDTWVSVLGNLVLSAIREGDSREGGTGLEEKKISAILTC